MEMGTSLTNWCGKSDSRATETLLQNSRIAQGSHRSLANRRFVWHQACPSSRFTCHRFYEAKNISRTSSLNIEQDIGDRGTWCRRKGHRWQSIVSWSDQKPHLVNTGPCVHFCEHPLYPSVSTSFTIIFRQRPEVAYRPARSSHMWYRT